MRAETDAVFEIPLSDAPDAARLSLTRAQCPATASAMVVDHQGRSRVVEVPGENALTVYLDKQEIVTLMTLGQAPEALIMGYPVSYTHLDVYKRQNIDQGQADHGGKIEAMLHLR